MFEWFVDMPVTDEDTQIVYSEEIYYTGNEEGFALFKQEVQDFLEDLEQDYTHVTEGGNIVYSSRTDPHQHIVIEDGQFEIAYLYREESDNENTLYTQYSKFLSVTENYDDIWFSNFYTKSMEVTLNGTSYILDYDDE